jgi:thiol-disulfide isomerase/thioredoxin
METLLKRSFVKGTLVLFLCLASAFLLTYCGKKEKESALAPNFRLKTLDDQEITLTKLEGKAILLDFWATWCGPCRESIPHLAQLYKTYHQRGLEVIGMSMDKGDIDSVWRFVKSMDIPYPIIITPDEVERSYGVTGLPTAILIDKEGKIRQKFMGFSTKIAKEMTAKVEELTSEKLQER